MEKLRKAIARRLQSTEICRGERGATATEYALLVGVIVLVVAAGVGAFGTALTGGFESLAASLSGWLT